MKTYALKSFHRITAITFMLVGISACQAPLPPGCPPGQLEPINSETKKAIQPTQQYKMIDASAIQTF